MSERVNPKLHFSQDGRAIIGYTLAEVLVVTLLISIAAALVLPFTRGTYGNFELRLATDSLRTLFRRANSQARFEGRIILVVFTQAERTTTTLFVVAEDGQELERLTLPPGIILSSEQDDGTWTDTPGPLHFFPDGTSESIQLDLRDARQKHVRVEVVSVHGNVEVTQVDGAGQ